MMVPILCRAHAFLVWRFTNQVLYTIPHAGVHAITCVFLLYLLHPTQHRPTATIQPR